MDGRTERALAIAATTRLQRSTNGWLVPSQSGNGSYAVASARPELRHTDVVSDLECSCPDFELRRLPCKHVLAVEIVIERETAVDGERVAETVRARMSYPQDWPSYNAAQCHEGDLFLPLLADLCRCLEVEPAERGRPGRPRLPLADMAFECVHRVYTGLSARRFDSAVRGNQADGLTRVAPSFTSVLRYLAAPAMTAALERLVQVSALPLVGLEVDFAADSTGFSSDLFGRWQDHRWKRGRRAEAGGRAHRTWVKVHLWTGVATNVTTTALVSGAYSHDTNYFVPMLRTTAEHFTIRDVAADKAYSSKENLQAVAGAGGRPLVPFKGEVPAFYGPPVHLPPSASAWVVMYHLFVWQRETFLAAYHVRSNVESTISMIKRKFGDSVRGRTEVAQQNEALCKVVANNLTVLISCMYELGLTFPRFGGGGSWATPSRAREVPARTHIKPGASGASPPATGSAVDGAGHRLILPGDPLFDVRRGAR
jgi:transposase